MRHLLSVAVDLALRFRLGIAGRILHVPRGRPVRRGARPLLEVLEDRTVPSPISDKALPLLGDRVTANQSNGFVYRDEDSPFNRGFPSGYFGTTTKIHVNPGAVDDPASPTGVSTDPNRLDATRGNVMQVIWDPLAPTQFAGVNIEEPEGGGASKTGRGYDFRTTTQIIFEVRSPTPGGVTVQFGVGGSVTRFVHVPQTASYYTLSFPLRLLLNPALTAASPPDLANLHILFGVSTNVDNAPNGGILLLDNIRFDAAPSGQSAVPSFPVSTQTLGVVPLTGAAAGRNPFPLDQVLRNVASTYESSLTLLALLRHGTAADLASARYLADAFVYALGHDNHGEPIPAAADGSTGLHNSYYSGDLPLFNNQKPPALGQQGDVRLAGFSTGPNLSIFFLDLDGAAGGNNAFAMLALLDAYRQFQDVRYLTTAETIGKWTVGNLTDTTGTGYGGYYLGYPDEGMPKVRQTSKSVENNADIFAAFQAVAQIERNLSHAAQADLWTARANVAGDFVMAMYDPVAGRFNAGTDPTGPQGSDVINNADFVDADTFTTLALAGSPRYRNQIDWRGPVQYVLAHFAQTVTAGGRTYQGFDLVPQPTAGPNGIAWEFTSQVVELMRFVDQLYGDSRFEGQAQSTLNQISSAQTSAPFGDGRGLVAATLQGGDTLTPIEQGLSTPFQAIPERVGLAATTWAIFADQGVNPFVSADHLAFAFQPSTTAAGAPITPAVTVQVLDQFGNLVTSDTSSVTITLANNSVGGTLSGTRTVAAVGGIATFSNLSLNKVGTGYTLIAADGSLSPATSAAFNVTQPQTTTAISAAPSPSVYGQSVTFTATVTAQGSGTGVSAGTVTFVIDGVNQTPVTVNAQGVATFSTRSLSVGSHSARAVYNGTTDFAGSATDPTHPLTQLVAKAVAQASVASSANPSTLGQPVTFTATVKAVPPGAGTPTGTVTFSIDGVAQAPPVALNASGQATLTLSTLTASSHTVNVVYNGDSNFSASALSPGLAQTVLGPPVRIVALAQPTVRVSTPFAVTVVALDAANQVVTTYATPADFIILLAPRGGTVTGPRVAYSNNGVAVFGPLRCTAAGLYVLQIRSGPFSYNVAITAEGSLVFGGGFREWRM